MHFYPHGPSFKGLGRRREQIKVVVNQRRVSTLLAPSNIVLRAGPWAYFGTPSCSPRSWTEDPLPWEGSLPTRLPNELLLDHQKLVSLDKAPFSTETRGRTFFFLPATPPQHLKSLGYFP